MIDVDILFVAATLPWRERVKLSVEKLEEGMDESRRDLLIVGKVLDKAVHEDRIHIKARQVRFSWQRGVKIGRNSIIRISCLLETLNDVFCIRTRNIW